MTAQIDLHAGGFSSWLRRTWNAQVQENGVDVPCGECTACCASSYFIHIRPEETRTLDRIPRKLLFAAPGLPKGNKVLGFDENGRCPMLFENKCSIYDHRPLTCRNYDCRIFSAAGIEAGGSDKVQITQRAKCWMFDYPAKRDRNQHSAVQAATLFLREHVGCFPAGFVPGNPTQLAVLAIKVYDVFLKETSESGKSGHVATDLEIAKRVMESYEKFEVLRSNSVS